MYLVTLRYCSADASVATMTGVLVGASTPASFSRVTAMAAVVLASMGPGIICMTVPSLCDWNIPARAGLAPLALGMYQSS